MWCKSHNKETGHSVSFKAGALCGYCRLSETCTNMNLILDISCYSVLITACNFTETTHAIEYTSLAAG